MNNQDIRTMLWAEVPYQDIVFEIEKAWEVTTSDAQGILDVIMEEEK